MGAATLAFLLLLPCATWLLGSVFGLLDRGDRAAALRRIAWRALPFLAAAVSLGSDAAWPAFAALSTALGLHVTSFTGARLAVRQGWWRSAAAPPDEE